MTALDDAPRVLDPGRTGDVLHAERAVLGSAIAYRDAAERVLEVLDRDDCFGEGVHRAVCAAVRWLTEEGALAVRGSLAADPDRDPAAATAVQSRYSAVLTRLIAAEKGVWRTGQAANILHDLYACATPSYMAEAAKVLNAARQRRLLAALVSARAAVSEPGFDAGESGDLIRKLVEDALDVPPSGAGAVTAADLFLSALERLESPEPPGVVQFPWSDLRRLVPYLRPGQLVSILARPSLGKSALAQDLARHVGLRRRLPCVLFTMEQGRDEVIDRMIAAEAGVLFDRIMAKQLDDADWSRIAAAKERFQDSRLVIDDTPRITPAHIRARLRGMARHEPAAVAIVDYLQLMAPPSGAENRQQEVTGLVAALKTTAREFGIPVVMLCQLNRGPEHRQDKRPHLSDARESGSVENDSDVAILIHREDFYESESPRAGEADLLVEKNRNGPRGTAVVGFQGHYARFVGLAADDRKIDPAEWTPYSAIGGLG